MCVCVHAHVHKCMCECGVCVFSQIWCMDVTGSSVLPYIVLLIVLGKRGYQVDIFLFIHKNIRCGYPLEGPHEGTSEEYPKNIFK